MTTPSRAVTGQSLDDRLEELRPHLDAVDLDNLPLAVIKGDALAKSNGDDHEVSDDETRLVVLMVQGIITDDEAVPLMLHLIDRRHGR